MKKSYFIFSFFLCVSLVVSIFLCRDAFAVSTPTLSVASDYYFDDYNALPDDWKNLCNAYINYFNNISSFKFSGLTEIPKSWFKILSDGACALSPVDDIFYFLSDGELVVEDHHGGSSGRHRASDTSPVVSSSFFTDSVDSDTTRTPKNTRNIMSWRNDPRYSEKGDSLSFPRLTWYNALSGGFIPLGGGNEIYMIPFYTDGEKMYFGNFQFHATVNNLKPQGTSYSFYTLDLEWLSFEVSLSEHNGSTRVSENSYYFAYDFSLPDSNAKGRFCVSPYDSIADFSSHSRHYDKYPSLNNDFLTLVCADDLGLTLDMSTVGGSHFGKSVAAHDESCDIGSGEDMGYFCSSTPIELDYHIDTQRIPDNYYITVEGDTIYDYTITDPDTGQSSTVNEYITNNYTYVTNEGGSSSGGSVGGNVTVGGQIDVSGSVDVGVDVNVSVPDININVNGGAGGTGALPDVDVNTDPLDEYLNSALEESSGIRQFFAAFFDFCPPEIFTLLCIGLTFVVLGRILGR